MKAMKRINKEGREEERKQRKKQRNQEKKKINKAFIIDALTLFFTTTSCGICVYVVFVFTLCLSLCAIHTNPVLKHNGPGASGALRPPHQPHSSFEPSLARLQLPRFNSAFFVLLLFWLLIYFDPFSLTSDVILFLMRFLFDTLLRTGR